MRRSTVHTMMSSFEARSPSHVLLTSAKRGRLMALIPIIVALVGLAVLIYAHDMDLEQEEALSEASETDLSADELAEDDVIPSPYIAAALS